MSKLDEELRAALRREEPSAGFAYRALERVRTLPPPKPGWRQSLLTLLRPPKVVWLAAGVAACLLIALGVQGLRGYESARVENNKIVADDATRSAEPQRVAPPEKQSPQPQQETVKSPGPETIGKRASHHHRNVVRETREEMEARQAMEQLELALYIASTKLNAAQRAVYKADSPVE